jgi:hypothetical protein
VVRTVRAIDVASDAGTAFDGRYFYQLAGDRIQKVDPATGAVVATIPAPGKGRDSGLTWAEGTLWVGQHRDRKIHQIDPETGAILAHDRVEPLRHGSDVGRRRALAWHMGRRPERHPPASTPRAARFWPGSPCPKASQVSGLESDGADLFYAGGGSSGKVRAVRRPKRMR